MNKLPRENELSSEALKPEKLLVSEPLASCWMNISRLARDLDGMFRFGMLSDICEGHGRKFHFFHRCWRRIAGWVGLQFCLGWSGIWWALLWEENEQVWELGGGKGRDICFGICGKAHTSVHLPHPVRNIMDA